MNMKQQRDFPEEEKCNTVYKEKKHIDQKTVEMKDREYKIMIDLVLEKKIEERDEEKFDRNGKAVIKERRSR